MRKYKAKIVGYKWSPKRMTSYKPVFVYEDADGIERKYIRRYGMEKTPFTEARSYYICKGKNGTYEKTEKHLSANFLFLCTKLIALICSMIFPNLALCFFCASSILWLFFRNIIPYICRKQTLALKNNVELIEGKIIGYQKLKRKDNNGNALFRPIIEYKYDNGIYSRVGKTICDAEKYPFHYKVNVYISKKRMRVYDHWELNQPIIDIGKYISSIKQLFTITNITPQKLADVDVKIYQPVNDKNKSYVTTATIPINIPLKTYNVKKAANWY